MKKVLIYNWARIDGIEGGGVTIYARNLINGLISSGEYSVTFLSSGRAYDTSKGAYIRRIDNNVNSKLKSYEIVNSPILAPAEQCAKNIRNYLNDNTLLPLLSDFIKINNGFDVIHFNNLEGLSVDVLRLKEIFPDMRIVYTLHNYFPFCSKVSLWQNANTSHPHNCNKKSYAECINCYNKKNYFITRMQRKFEMKIIGRLGSFINKIYQDDGEAELYKMFTDENINYISKYVDTVLAVSKRVSEIAVEYGLPEEKVAISYIGTKVAEKAKYKCTEEFDGNVLKIAYMGYMRHDKGYYFLIDSLKQMPEKYAKRIEVKIVAKHNKLRNYKELKEIKTLNSRYNRITVVDGYNFDNQELILKDVHLGIVPVLWEDNLPQVAIEQIAYGVPVLVSNFGGAKELFRDDHFVFKAGDPSDFISKLMYIMDNKEILPMFWNSVNNLTTIDEHVKEIKQYY